MGLHFPLRTWAPIAFGHVPMWCPAMTVLHEEGRARHHRRPFGPERL